MNRGKRFLVDPSNNAPWFDNKKVFARHYSVPDSLARPLRSEEVAVRLYWSWRVCFGDLQRRAVTRQNLATLSQGAGWTVPNLDLDQVKEEGWPCPACF